MTTWLNVWASLDAERAQSADAIAIDLGADTEDVERAAKALSTAGILGFADGHYRRTAEAESQVEVEQLAAAAGIELGTSLKARAG